MRKIRTTLVCHIKLEESGKNCSQWSVTHVNIKIMHLSDYESLSDGSFLRSSQVNKMTEINWRTTILIMWISFQIVQRRVKQGFRFNFHDEATISVGLYVARLARICKRKNIIQLPSTDWRHACLHSLVKKIIYPCVLLGILKHAFWHQNPISPNDEIVVAIVNGDATSSKATLTATHREGRRGKKQN